MSGVRLEAKVHIVTGAVLRRRRTSSSAPTGPASTWPTSCCSRWPRARPCSPRTRRSSASCLVDIGGGTTDIAIFANGAIVHTAVIALGGNHLTNDIAVGLRTPAHEAERIKQKLRLRLASMVDKDETIEVPSVGGRQPRVLARQILCEILEPRVEEIFQLVQREIQKCGYEDLLAGGVVITGGATLLAGHARAGRGGPRACRCAAGCRRGIGGLVDVVKSPMYATGVGLVLYGAKHQDRRVLQDPRGERLPARSRAA